eukprot:scaffold62616_cov37-Phaeocystis_antarctica.AAC.2
MTLKEGKPRACRSGLTLCWAGPSPPRTRAPPPRPPPSRAGSGGAAAPAPAAAACGGRDGPGGGGTPWARPKALAPPGPGGGGGGTPWARPTPCTSMRTRSLGRQLATASLAARDCQSYQRVLVDAV